MLRTRPVRRGAARLVELLVCMAIIAIMASLMIPSAVAALKAAMALKG